VEQPIVSTSAVTSPTPATTAAAPVSESQPSSSTTTAVPSSVASIPVQTTSAQAIAQPSTTTSASTQSTASEIKPSTPEQPQLADDEGTITGIDTVELDDPQGNWLYKRLWWERSEAKYEKLRKEVATVVESRGQFYDKRANAEKNIFDFVYQQIGFERGELEELISRLTVRMNKLREKEGSLDEKEREFYAQLQTEKQSLDTLTKNVAAINALENSVDDILQKLMEQIGRVREYEQDAWQNFKEIARTLDDRKAKELFYKIDAIWRNVTSLKEYIQTRLSTHFDQLLTKAGQEADLLKKGLQELKDKGLDLQKQEEHIEQYYLDKEAARIRALESPQEELGQEEEPGFIHAYIINPLLTVWNGIIALITWPYYALVGYPESEEDQDQQEQEIAKSTSSAQVKSSSETVAVVPSAPSSLPTEQVTQPQTTSPASAPITPSEPTTNESISVQETPTITSQEPAMNQP
jgi:rubrerythrin